MLFEYYLIFSILKFINLNIESEIFLRYYNTYRVDNIFLKLDLI